MSIDINALHALPAIEKLRLVEFLWDDLGDSTSAIPLPEWMAQEITRRREEMQDPAFGISHEEAWRRIANRNG
jgi:putative addiction module component (TIGR02574 family)